MENLETSEQCGFQLASLPSPSSLLTGALGSHLALSDSHFSRLAPIEKELMNTRLDSYPLSSKGVGEGKIETWQTEEEKGRWLQ
jgi:hypothetical protein